LPEPLTDKVNFDGNLVLIERQDGSSRSWASVGTSRYLRGWTSLWICIK